MTCWMGQSSPSNKFVLNSTGLRSEPTALQITVFSRHNKRENWESTEAWLNPTRQCMERDGHAHIQYMALVDSQRKRPIVRLPFTSAFAFLSDNWNPLIRTHSSCRWDYIQDGSTISKDMNRLMAFYKGLTTWARWVDLNVDPTKTKVFFQGISPTHYQ